MANTLWNKKRTHQIPDSLSHSSGTVTAVFGSTTLITSLTGLTANSLYFLYVRKVSGVTSLVYSTTVPSTYRVSFIDAVLVGAFYSNGLTSVAYGDFVNIENTPKCGPIESTLIITDQNGVNVLSSTPIFKKSLWTRDGEFLSGRFSYYHTTSTGIAGTGTYFFVQPFTFSDATKLVPGGGNSGTPYGDVRGDIGATSISSWALQPTANTPNLQAGPRLSDGVTTAVFIGASSFSMNTSNLGLSGAFGGIPITGWSKTPLKDL